MVQICQVDFHLVGPNDGVVICLRVRLLGQQFFLIAVFDAGRTRDAGTKLQDAAVIALQLVGIAWHVGTRPYKTHLSDEDIDQLGETIHFAMTQPMAHTGDTRVVGRSDRIAFSLVKHGAEFTNLERFSTFPYAFLHKKHRPFRVNFDKNTNDE